jgi:hypothetical protein
MKDKDPVQILREFMDKEDTIIMDVPLFIRLLEYAREEAKTDMDLHNMAEKAIKLSLKGNVLTMKNYTQLT